jgi:flagellar biosynthesis protein FlhB
MIANCAVECRDLSASINRELVEWLEATEKAILDRLKRARKEGDLAPGEDIRALARYFATVLQGMVALSRIKRDAKELRHVVRIALRAWPEPAATVGRTTR